MCQRVRGMSKSSTVFRVKHPKRPFTMVPNDVVEDNRISADAFRMLCRIMRMPDSFEFSMQWLRDTMRCGRDRAREIVAELDKAGYCRQSRQRTDGGRLGSIVCEFSFGDWGSESHHALDNQALVHQALVLPSSSNKKQKYKNCPLTPTPNRRRSDPAQSGQVSNFLDGEGKGSPAIAASLIAGAEGMGLDARALASRAKAEKPEQAEQAFRGLCEGELVARLPSMPLATIREAIAGNPAARGALFEAIIRADVSRA